MANLPTYEYEANLQLNGSSIIAGVDEVGRGCLAGPVVSAAVIFDKNINLKILKE